MDVEKTPFNDESDKPGEYSYRGEYFKFSEKGKQPLTFKRYSEEDVAWFVEDVAWRPPVYASGMFKRAVEYLKRETSVKSIKIMNPNGGFVVWKG